MLSVSWAVPASPLERLRIVLPQTDQGVADALENASLLVEQYRDDVTSPTDLIAAARADYARMVGALYSEGYYGGTVNILVDGREAADINPLSTPARINEIIVRVTPGPLYRFERAAIGPLASGTDLPSGYDRGEPAEANVIKDAVDAAVVGWRNVGNAKADVAGQRVVANHATNTLDSSVRIDPGPRLRFGRLIIDKESRMSDRRIRKIAGLPTGTRFSPEKLDTSASRLRDTGVFRAVALTEAEVPNADGTLDIFARVIDRKPRRFGFGAEYLSDEGATLSAFWLHRNLLGGGERFRVGGEISGIGGTTGGEDYEINLDLSRPATFGADTDAFVTFELASVEEEEYSSESATLGFGVIHRVDRNVTARAAIEYGYSRDEDDAGVETTYRQLFFPVGVTADQRENVLDTNDGWYVDAEIAPFYGLSDSESGVRVEVDARAYEDFGEDSRVVFAARLQAGSISGASITGLPNDLRFYSGGSGTVRGQDYQSLGVDLGNDVLSGGRSFLGLQTELRTKVSERISLVGFYDFGIVGEDSVPGTGDSHAGAGIGLRYATGFGPLRVDLGVPVSGDTDSSDFQLYIGVGQAF